MKMKEIEIVDTNEIISQNPIIDELIKVMYGYTWRSYNCNSFTYEEQNKKLSISIDKNCLNILVMNKNGDEISSCTIPIKNNNNLIKLYNKLCINSTKKLFKDLIEVESTLNRDMKINELLT